MYGVFPFSQVWITKLKVSKWALLNHFLLSIGVDHLLTSSLYTILISLDKCSNFYYFAWQKCLSNFQLHALFSFILSCFMLQYKFLIFKLKVRASFSQDHVPISFFFEKTKLVSSKLEWIFITLPIGSWKFLYIILYGFLY